MARYKSKERQEAETLRHRQEILSAATRVFARTGFHEASMQDIAREAEFSVGKIYLHFPSKQVLYQELLEQFLGVLLQRFERAVDAEGPAMQRIENAIRVIFDYFELNPLMLNLFVNETLGFEFRIKTEFGLGVFRKYQRMLEGFTRAVQAGIDSGEFAGASASQLTLKLTGIMNAFLAASVYGNEHHTSADATRIVLDLFYHSPLSGKKRTSQKAGSHAS